MNQNRLGKFATDKAKEQVDKWSKEHINYFEVILDPNGEFIPLTGSHESKLIQIFCSQFGMSSEYEAFCSIPKRHHGSMEYLSYTTDHLPVWYSFYQGSPNLMQLYTLYYAREKGVYSGDIINPFDI